MGLRCGCWAPGQSGSGQGGSGLLHGLMLECVWGGVATLPTLRRVPQHWLAPILLLG